ncbi:MAG: MFS transporter [bacterium]|nr:MFS transporter [bacterium]
MTPPAPPLLTPRFVRLNVANFCFFLCFASFFLLPLHVRALGGSDRDVGFVMGTNGVAGLAGLLLIGPLLDRFPRQLFLRGGIAGMGLLALAYLVVDTVGPLLYLLRAFQGLAFAAGFNAASTLAVDYAPPARRGAALGLYGVSTLATHALAPTLGEMLIGLGGFPLLFVSAAGYAAVGLVAAWSLPAATLPVPRGRGRFRLGGLLAATLAAVGCGGIAFGAVITFAPTFVADEHLGPVATFFLSYTAAAIATRLVGGGLGDRFGHARVATPALAGLGVAIAALALVYSPVQLALAGLAFGTAQGIYYPALNAFTVDHAGAGQIGRVQTLYNATFNLGVTGGAFVLGNVVHDFGHRVTFLCASAAALLGVACFVLAVRLGPRVRH